MEGRRIVPGEIGSVSNSDLYNLYKIPIEKSGNLWYLIVTRGDTNVQVSLSPMMWSNGRVSSAHSVSRLWDGWLECGRAGRQIRKSTSNLQKEGLITDVRYQDRTEMTLGCCESEDSAVKGHFFFFCDNSRLIPGGWGDILFRWDTVEEKLLFTVFKHTSSLL